MPPDNATFDSESIVLASRGTISQRDDSTTPVRREEYDRIAAWLREQSNDWYGEDIGQMAIAEPED